LGVIWREIEEKSEGRVLLGEGGCREETNKLMFQIYILI